MKKKSWFEMSTCWHKIKNKFDISNVRAARCRSTNSQALLWVRAGNLVPIEHSGSHAGKDKEEEGKELEVGGKDTAGLSVGDRLC